MSRPGSTEVQPRCRVTVVGARNEVDLAVPAEAPIAEYADLLARLVGQDSDDLVPPTWSLAVTGAPPLPVTASLASAGVVDGSVLYLRDVLDGEADEPVVRSVWEVVSEVGDTGRGARWDSRTKGRAAVLLGAAWLLVTLGYLGMTERSWPLVEALTAIIGIGFAVTARLLRPYPRVLPGNLWKVLGWAVVPSMTMLSMLSLGRPEWDAKHLVYTEIGALLGLVIALVAMPGVMLAAVTLLVVLAGAVTALVLGLGATSSATAATVVTAGALFLAVAPHTAGLLTAASWLRMSSPSVEPDLDPKHLANRVRRAQHTLVLLLGVASAIVAVALLVLTQNRSVFSLVLAGVAAVALLLRANTFSFFSEAIGPVVAALSGFFGLLTALAHWSATEPLVLPVTLLAGLSAVGAGLPILLWRVAGRPEPAGTSPTRSRLAPLLSFCQIALPPLLLGVFGVYNVLWTAGNNF